MRSRLIVLLALPALLLPPASAHAADRAGDARRLDSITIEGRGAGHGHGMSQWGAEGAARQGRTYQQILRFYYPHTRTGRAGGTIRVLITAASGKRLTVRAREGLTVRAQHGSTKRLGKAEPRARRWRLVPARARTMVQFQKPSGSWHRWRSLRGWAQFAAPGPIELKTATGFDPYHGKLRSGFATTSGNRRQVVNVVGLESYLRGVVPAEVPALWHRAAVKAQAVAARTYAVYERDHATGRGYDLCDTAACQVYAGVDVEHDASDAAVRATARRVLTHRGSAAFTQFSASNGGWSRAGDQPYLVARKDPYDRVDDNPYLSWTVQISATQIERAWPAIGALSQVDIDERDGNGEWGGRVLQLTITGDQGAVTVDGDTFRSRMGLLETWFNLT